MKENLKTVSLLAGGFQGDLNIDFQALVYVKNVVITTNGVAASTPDICINITGFDESANVSFITNIVRGNYNNTQLVWINPTSSGMKIDIKKKGTRLTVLNSDSFFTLNINFRYI